MATRKFVNQVKASCLPCYLSDNEYTPTHLHTDSNDFDQFKQLPYQNFQLESSKPANVENSPSIHLPDSINLSKTLEASSLTFLDKKNLSSKLGRAVRSYLQLDSFTQELARKKNQMYVCRSNYARRLEYFLQIYSNRQTSQESGTKMNYKFSKFFLV